MNDIRRLILIEALDRYESTLKLRHATQHERELMNLKAAEVRRWLEEQQ